MFISPLVFDSGDIRSAPNDMIFGGLVILLGVGTVCFEVYYKERLERETGAGTEHATERVRPSLRLLERG